jgi:hypothetical protein
VSTRYLPVLVFLSWIALPFVSPPTSIALQNEEPKADPIASIAPQAVSHAATDSNENELRQQSFVLETRKFWLSLFGFAGTIVALLFAAYQYRRAEQWKQAEFLAREMKEFFESPSVRNALTMIDWGSRRVNLFNREKPTPEDLVLVTRAIQCRALLPHTIVNADAASDVEVVERSGEGGRMSAFTPEGAAIRDSYDAFLDGLERFSSFLGANLVTVEALQPYLSYWIDDIAAPTEDRDDAAWCCCLLAYIHFYRFTGVQDLFDAFRKNIRPTGEAYKRFSQHMNDPLLAQQLAVALNLESNGEHAA